MQQLSIGGFMDFRVYRGKTHYDPAGVFFVKPALINRHKEL